MGCRQDMHDQPKYAPFRPNPLFADQRSARPLPEGTIARGHQNDTAPQNTGVDTQGQFLTTMPVELTASLVGRGQERYEIFCSPCHGEAGDAQGMAARRGVRAPPSFFNDRSRRLPVGYIYAVITNGYGGMSSYAHQIPPADRWAIVAFIRALQLGRQETAQ